MSATAAWKGLCLAIAVTLGADAAAAQDKLDKLKLAIGQKGNWDTAIPELGTRAGIFSKHGLELELLAPGKELVLHAGGLHLALTGVKKAFHAYDDFQLELVFEKAGRVVVDVVVEEAEPEHRH